MQTIYHIMEVRQEKKGFFFFFTFSFFTQHIKVIFYMAKTGSDNPGQHFYMYWSLILSLGRFLFFPAFLKLFCYDCRFLWIYNKRKDINLLDFSLPAESYSNATSVDNGQRIYHKSLLLTRSMKSFIMIPGQAVC